MDVPLPDTSIWQSQTDRLRRFLSTRTEIATGNSGLLACDQVVNVIGSPKRPGSPAAKAASASDFGGGRNIGEAQVSPSLPLGDQYASRHNPFVYFHSIIDSKECDPVVSLNQLPIDLQSKWTTPDFVFVIPNLCDDGHDGPGPARASRVSPVVWPASIGSCSNGFR
jgi:hypothetical protein